MGKNFNDECRKQRNIGSQLALSSRSKLIALFVPQHCDWLNEQRTACGQITRYKHDCTQTSQGRSECKWIESCYAVQKIAQQTAFGKSSCQSRDASNHHEKKSFQDDKTYDVQSVRTECDAYSDLVKAHGGLVTEQPVKADGSEHNRKNRKRRHQQHH